MAGLSTYIETNFPTPSNGQTFIWGGVRYTYDSTPGVWVGQLPEPGEVTDAAVTVVAPSNPSEGDFWYDGSRLNVRYENAWVAANPQPTADDLDIGPVLVVQREGNEVTTGTTTLNFTTRTSADSGSAVNVTATTSNQAQVEIVFPNVAASAGLPTTPVEGNTMSNQMSVLQTSPDGDQTWVPLPDADEAAASAIANADLSALGNVATTAPTMGQFLQYDGTEWTPALIPTATTVAIDTDGDTVTIGTTDTEIPVVNAATLNAANQLVLTRNGADNLTVDLSGLATTADTPPPMPILNVNDFENVAQISFDDRFVLGGDASNVTIDLPEETRLSVAENGTARNLDVTRINFVSGASVVDAGDGVVNVTVAATGGAGGSGEIQTSFSNITRAENLLRSVDQATNDRAEFTISGGVGGSRYRVMFRAVGTGTVQFTTNSATAVSNVTLWGSRTFGLWDTQEREIAVFRAPPSQGSYTWAQGRNFTLSESEVIMMEVDLTNNGTMTFTSNSGSRIVWESSEQNTSTADVTTEMVMPEEEEDAPAADPPVTTGAQYPASQPAMCGPYWIQNQPAESEADNLIVWAQEGVISHPKALDGTGLRDSPITGGNRTSGKDTGGNAIWGFNQNRPPSGALFLGRVRSGPSINITDPGTTDQGPYTLGASVTTMCTILFPHEDDCGVLNYLEGLNLDWTDLPVYSYTRLGGTYSGTAATDRRIVAWQNTAITTTDNSTGLWAYPGTFTSDGRQSDGNFVTTVNGANGIGPRFAPGLSRTNNGRTVILGQRTMTDSQSGFGQGAFSDQLKLNLVIPFSGLIRTAGGQRGTTVHTNDFGDTRYMATDSSALNGFKTQFVMPLPGTNNILFMEARQTTPREWVSSNHGGNAIYGFELGYRVMRVSNVNNAGFLRAATSDGTFDARTAYLSNSIRGNERATGVDS